MAPEALSEYLRTAADNIAASLATPDQWIKKIRAVDACMHELTDNLSEAVDVLTAAFALDSHSRLAAASLLALAGAMDETYAVARSALESALYANLLNDNDVVRDRWFRRDEDPECRKALRNDLTTKKLIDAIEARDPVLAAHVRSAYEDAITFGAHPNVGSIAGSMKITETEEQTEYIRPFLGGSLVEVAGARKHLVITGISIIEIYGRLMPDLAARRDLPRKLIALKTNV